MNLRTMALTLRIVGIVAVVAAVAAAIVALQSMNPISGVAIVLAAVALIEVGALTVVLFGVAALIDQSLESPAELSRGLGRMEEEINALATRIESLGADIDQSATTQRPSGDIEQQLDRLQELILLTDAERQRHARSRVEAVAEQALLTAGDLINERRWSEAEHAIAEVERALPGFPRAAELRTRMQQEKVAADREIVSRSQSEIESAMARGAWADAIERAQFLKREYPTDAVIDALAQRVEREWALYNEATSQRLFEEIRHESERRNWRRALVSAEELLAKCPTHEKAQRVRLQLHTLQQNAEIEERHEIENRVGELVRTRRFADAIIVAEDLLRRFPLSPQARTFEKLLPHLREKATTEQSNEPRTE
ncbi:MAG: hypothetical protein JO353_06295 [Phycisphaerae bacterium]|nr:hypothetical protein [Phycisphaerae bacterium]